MGLITDQAVKAAKEAIQPLIDAAKGDLVKVTDKLRTDAQTAASANELARKEVADNAAAALKAAEDKATTALKDAKTAIEAKVTTAQNAANAAQKLATANAGVISGVGTKAEANEKAIKKLTDDAANVKQTATDAKNAADQANATLGKADKKLQEMKVHDEAVGRILKAMSIWLDSGQDLDKFGKDLIQKGAKQEDIDLFKIKK